jgi:hypothetical protein
MADRDRFVKIECKPHEARLTPSMSSALMNGPVSQLVIGCNGFCYAGDRADAIISAVQLLRVRPDLALALGIGGQPDDD